METVLSIPLTEKQLEIIELGLLRMEEENSTKEIGELLNMINDYLR